MIKDRLCKLRETMKEAGVDCLLIPTSDYHDSEYVCSFFRAREHFSGFTGSAGTLAVWQEEAALFTDGRYFIQAGKELEGSGITLMKIGEPGVPTLKEYLEKKLAQGQSLGFDGRVVQAGEAGNYEKILEKKEGRLVWDRDLAGESWENRPRLIHHPVFVLEERYSGESAASKIERVRAKMQDEGADLHILTSLDDIAWLLNIRGNDVKSCPVVLSYLVLTMDKVLLFAKGKDDGEEVWSGKLKEYLKENGTELLFYDDFYDYVSKIRGQKVLLSLNRINCRVRKELAEDVTVIDRPNPTALMKSVKNQVEMENLRKSHLKDGVAVTHFMYWLKKNAGKLPMTEVSAAEYLEELRRQQENFIEPSFDTICAYGPNGAINHYSAKAESCAEIVPGNLLVVDSGGHYLEGSTDITRTFAIGSVPEEMKEHFTLVLRSMLNLKYTRFLYGCRGLNLDVRAREVLWEKGLDYKHGTGHGVGYILSVHEGPNNFRWRPLTGLQDNAVLEEGMVTTDEPGIYIEGSHGIRIENELLCRKGEANEYGQFMYFEDLTCAPIDMDAVNVSQLEEVDKRRLNAYHREVFERLSPCFEGEELAWLKDITKEV